LVELWGCPRGFSGHLSRGWQSLFARTLWQMQKLSLL